MGNWIYKMSQKLEYKSFFFIFCRARILVSVKIIWMWQRGIQNIYGVPKAESFHTFWGLGKGISRQQFPCFFMQRGWFEPSTSRTQVTYPTHCTRPAPSKRYPKCWPKMGTKTHSGTINLHLIETELYKVQPEDSQWNTRIQTFHFPCTDAKFPNDSSDDSDIKKVFPALTGTIH